MPALRPTPRAGPRDPSSMPPRHPPSQLPPPTKMVRPATTIDPTAPAMTPDVEAVALAWVARHLRTHRCDHCGGLWITRASVAVIFHQCRPPRPALDWATPRQRVEEQRMDWARRLLTDGLIEAVEAKDGPDSLLREVDEW